MHSNPPKAIAFYTVKSAMDFHSRCNVVKMLPSSLLLLMLTAFALPSHAEIPGDLAEKIRRINARGVHDSLIVSGRDELRSIVSEENGIFKPFKGLPSVDISARRFHVGDIGERRTIVVMCGPGMANAAQTTQLLVTLFRVRAVVHYGRAGLANSNKGNIGDVVIPRQFAHTGIFYWEKFGGDDSSYDRDIANLTFTEYNVGDKKVGNELQSVYFQPEVMYSAEGKPEEGKPQFWMKVDDRLYATAQKLEESVKLDKCVREKKSSACLQEQPKIRRVERGSSANIYVNNEAYRDFLHTQLDVTSIDTQSAAIAMVCESEKRPFIAMRSITNYAGGSFEGNDVTVILDLWPQHARSSLTEFFNQLPPHDSDIRSVTGPKIW